MTYGNSDVDVAERYSVVLEEGAHLVARNPRRTSAGTGILTERRRVRRIRHSGSLVRHTRRTKRL